MRRLGMLVAVLAGASFCFADQITFTLTGGGPVVLGNEVTIDIAMVGLTQGKAPSLAAYDMKIDYNTAILNDPSVSFGDPILGDQLALTVPSFKCDGLAAGCHMPSDPLEIVEVSLDPSSVLNTSQAGAFILAQITFHTVGTGTSAVDLSNIALDDAFGHSLGGNLVVINGQVDVTSSTPAVPEPGSLLLLASALAGGLLLRRRTA